MSQPCHHGQSKSHQHHHVGIAEGVTPAYVKKLRIALVLAIVYLIAQGLGAAYSGSLALLADAGHKLADTLAMALALAASWIASLAASRSKTFGFHRLEILAAFFNGFTLFCIAVYIMWEAIQRLMHGETPEIEGGLMLAVSIFGLLINLVSAGLLFPAKELNLNVKGALFHLVTDIADSVGTMLTALGVMFFHWVWLDAALSLLIAILVIFNALRLFREAFNILMESAPSHGSVAAILSYLETRPGVTDVHDLHLWTITTGKDALLVHVQVDESRYHPDTVRHLEADLRHRFGLCHLTIQLEPPGFEEAAIPF